MKLFFVNCRSHVAGRKRVRLAVIVFAVCGLQFAAVQAALADGTYCWCRDQAWICTNHRANQVIPGGSVGETMTTEQCRSYCLGLGRNAQADMTYSPTTICTGCVEGGSCTRAAAPSVVSAANTCIIRDRAMQQNVTTLAECCTLNREGAEGTPPTRVGYSGRVQDCPADVASETAVTTTGPIRLFNPLGAETDIPAFIGRGIRGVLGVIGAIALLMFVYGGVVWMTAGDSKRVDDAKNIIKNSVIGLLLIFFSYSLIGIFFDLFT